MKLKIIFNSISILSLSEQRATTKVTADCDKHTILLQLDWVFVSHWSACTSAAFDDPIRE
jgi:hypothetical protein